MPATPRHLTIEQYQALLTGLPLHCSTTTFTLAGTTYTAPQAVSVVSSVLAALHAVPTARAALSKLILAKNQSLAKDGVTVNELRDTLAVMFSNAPDTLHDLGMVPRKTPTPLSAEARVAAEAKAKATRIARGTTSKKQKAAITGNVTGVNITPLTSTAANPGVTPAAAPAATPAPVPTAASGNGAAHS